MNGQIQFPYTNRSNRFVLMINHMIHIGIRQGPLLIILAAGLIIRLVLLSHMDEMGVRVVDERHYFQLATGIFSGWGFAWGPEVPTSARPPLYPAFLALVWTVIGEKSIWAIRVMQIGLSLLNVAILFSLGQRIFSRRVGLWAAAIFCFYPSLIAFNFFLLTEVLFTLLLTLFAFGCVVLLQSGRPALAVGTGFVLGLAVLTRSVLWPFPIILCPLAFLSLQGNRGTRLKLAGCLLLGYLMVVAPWAVRNTSLQGVFTVVNSMGGITLLMGNYEHTPLNRPWDVGVTLRGEHSIYNTYQYQLREKQSESANWTEGQREKWAQKMAFAFMLEHPVLTVKRSILKFASFWGLERSVLGGFRVGYYHPPQWFEILASLVITLAYVLVMVMACLGVFLAAPDNQRIHWLFLLIIFFVSGIHALVFGHSRYHLPLIPFLILYAASALTQHSWQRFREGLRVAAAPMAASLALLAIWGREVLVVEAERLRTLVDPWLG